MESAIVYRSVAMSKVMALVDRVVATDASVLITGESGTGKNLLAERIHRLGSRGKGPFVVVPCANIPADLFESELFGVEAGAHTEADSRRPGKLEGASGGTVYLDGVDRLGSPLQAKLLRVVQEKRFERLGGTETVSLDVRFISSASDGLEADVGAAGFREDLYYRLNVVHLRLPPLRERGEDIGPLASHILRQLSARYGGGQRRLGADARQALRSYRWPGNVRELENALETAVIGSSDEEISAAALRLPRGSPAERALREALDKKWSLQTLEETYIREVLKAAGGNKSRAAAMLGINRKTLLQKLRRSAR